MERAWEKNIRRVVPYTPGEQPKGKNIIKLNTNENPYPPSPAAEDALRGMDISGLRKYPDPTCGPLVEAISRERGIPEDQIFTGVGSDEVLALSFLTFFNSGKPILFPDITYSFYDVWAGLFGIPYRTVPLDDAFAIRPEAYEAENGGVVFPNPNAPTGRLLPTQTVEEIIRRNRDSIVIVDEAYIDFGGQSMLPLLDRYDNLVVVQTFSKSRSLAGMRIGAAFGSRELIAYLRDVKYSFNSYTMNTPSLLAGAAAASDTAYYEETCRRVMETRERSARKLRELGFVFDDSAANFLFVTHPRIRAEKLGEELRGRGIYVRHFGQERIDNYLRITVGTDEEMDALFAALEEILDGCR